MVLHDIANDAKLVKIASSAFCPKRLLERNLDIVNVIPVPRGAKKLVSESQNEQVLDHFLSKVMVDPEDFLFLPVRLQGSLQLPRTGQILAKRLFYNDSRDALFGVTVPLEVLRDGNEHARGQSHVEYPILFWPPLLNLLEVFPEVDKGLVLVILPRDICTELAKVIQLLLHLLGGRLDVRLDPFEVLCMVHFRPRISNDFDVLG